NIFLFTSDMQEGWGVVLNEAMSNCCAIVASNKIGAVPFLIKHKENGLVFKSKSLKSLVFNVELLMNDEILRNKYSKNAAETISKDWSAYTASKNLISLFEATLSKKHVNLTGPCSKN
ncbi:glycosyltransferase, partial [Bacteroidota bacterium]